MKGNIFMFHLNTLQQLPVMPLMVFAQIHLRTV